MGDEGFEPPADSSKKTQESKRGGAKSGAVAARSKDDGELGCVVEAWPTLPHYTKQAILALVNVTGNELM